MPIAKKEVKKEAVSKKESVAAHKHDDLLKEIAALKKELQSVKAESAALKGQCHSCCGDIADLKLKVSNLASKEPVQLGGDQIEKLLNLIWNSHDYASLRIALRKAGFKL